MTVTIQNEDGIDGLDVQAFVAAKLGTGWVSGGAASLVDRNDAIEIDVTAATVRINGTKTSVTAGSVILDDGHPDFPRKDIVYADSNGALQVAKGTALSAEPEGAVARKTRKPRPADLSTLDAVALAEVWVPAEAGGADDFVDPGVNYVRDRRLPVWADELSTSDTQRTDEEIQDVVGALVAAGSNVSVSYDDAGNTLTISATDTDTQRTNEEIRDVAGGMAATGLAHDDANDTLSLNVVATGSVALSSGAATVDTGVATTQTATFQVALGPATADADVGAEIRADSTSGTYQVDIVESPDTAVGNPTVEYDIIRVR